MEERQGTPSIFQKLKDENKRLLDEAARENAEWEEAAQEFNFLCQDCMAPLVGALDFIKDGDDVPEEDVLAAFPGGKQKMSC